MARQRFTPLILAVACGALALIARLYQLQVVEGAFWSSEARNLVRAGVVRPYERGAILDTTGRVLARDEPAYRVQFNYRDFRRGHPLGIVAHARSALLGTPVALADALENLPQWTDELVALTSGDLECFGRGEPIALGHLVLPGSDDPERDERRPRRSDVRFYVTQLFELDTQQARAFAKACKRELDVPLLELAARERALGDAATLRARVAERLAVCSADLEMLARQLELDGDAPEVAGSALERLIARIEARRVEVENECAAALFEEACGFSAGRIEPATLLASVDLSWIANRLTWNGERLAAWLDDARRRTRESLFTGRIERLVAELEADSHGDDLPRRIAAGWLEPFLARDARELVVLADLDRLFTQELEAPAIDALVFSDALESGAHAEFGWRELAQAEIGLWSEPADVEARAEQWSRAFEDGFARDFLRRSSERAVLGIEEALQLATRTALAAGVAAQERLFELSAERLDRASERARYILKDRGSRLDVVATDPSYATVHLLARHRDRFAGFVVGDAQRRARLEDQRGVRIAGALLGEVATMTAREALFESGLRADFEALRRKGLRTPEEEAELVWLARRVVRGDELRGKSGVEAYFDHELAGRNGYREVRGLQDLIDGVEQLDVPPEHGVNVTLTLDVELQRAALEVLTAPERDPDAAFIDSDWLASPTGAIVLMTVDGDVLAAASYPDFARDTSELAAVRDLPFERTLRKPTFQPPGSCFKPFVAAWALDHVDFDPLETHMCAMLADQRGAGYLDVRCNAFHGHGSVDLRSSIARSCNAYFARLGERVPRDDWARMAAEFGFGRPTGVRALGARTGLLEDRVAGLFERAPEGRSARLAANGLAVVEATPMQVARATAGLATGVLPEVRLARQIGAVELPRRSRRLSLSSASLDFVRDAMLACAQESAGSAQPALDARTLGFRVAAKTGSADIGTSKSMGSDGRERVRKHTWLVSFFPYDVPRYVLVVFCHDTLATASHGAIWIARQYLTHAAVRALVDGGAR